MRILGTYECSGHADLLGMHVCACLIIMARLYTFVVDAVRMFGGCVLATGHHPLVCQDLLWDCMMTAISRVIAVCARFVRCLCAVTDRVSADTVGECRRQGQAQSGVRSELGGWWCGERRRRGHANEACRDQTRASCGCDGCCRVVAVAGRESVCAGSRSAGMEAAACVCACDGGAAM